MAGTLRGKIDCYSDRVAEDERANEVGKSFWDFMEAHPNVERLAYNFGDDNGSFGVNEATGTDYWGDANPWGSNHSWVLYRMPANVNRDSDIYIRATWGDSTTGTAADPILVNGSGASNSFFSLSIASARESDGTTNASPWQGTTNNDGTDTVGATPGTGPVWGAPVGGSLAVWPISNRDDYSDGTNKQSTCAVFDQPNPPVRFGFIADDDNLFCYFDQGDNGFSYWQWVGPLIWRDDVTADPRYDICYLSENSGMSFNGGQVYGSATGSAIEGGVYSPVAAQMEKMYLTSLIAGVDVAQPGNITGSAQYTPFPMHAYVNEAPDTEGYIGILDPNFIKVVYGIPDRDTKSDLDYIVLGDDTAADYNVMVPWDGATAPGSTFSRVGVDFTI